MDLRTRKTRRALREAFLDYRRTVPLERMTVRELCERAEVGKATFYLHYHSVYDLSDEIQAEVVERIVGELGDTAALLTRPADFTRALFRSFAAHSDEIAALFSGAQEHELVDHVERELRGRILAGPPRAGDDLRFLALLTYVVHGCHAAYMRHAQSAGEKDRAIVIDALADATQAVASLW